MKRHFGDKLGNVTILDDIKEYFVGVDTDVIILLFLTLRGYLLVPAQFSALFSLKELLV